MDNMIPGTDREFMERAIREAKNSVSEAGKNSPRVGAVVVKDGQFVEAAYRGELGEGEHAEFTLLCKKLRDVDVSGATLFTTLEPCTSRNPPKRPCATWIAERKIAEIVIGTLDPDPRIYGNGLKSMMSEGIKHRFFHTDLRMQIEELDSQFRKKFLQNASPEGTATFNYMRNNGIYTIGNGDMIFESRWGKCSGTSVYLRNDTPTISQIGLAIHATAFEEVTDPGVYDMSSWNAPIREGEVAVLRNNNGYYALIKVVDVKDKGRDGDERDEMTFEYKILEPSEEPKPPAARIEPGALSKSQPLAAGAIPRTPNPPFATSKYEQFLAFISIPRDRESIEESVSIIDALHSAIHKLPSDIRSVLYEVASRASLQKLPRGAMAAICREVELALGSTPHELREYVAILNRVSIATIKEDTMDGIWKIYLLPWHEWDIWKDITSFCDSKELSLAKLIVDNRFDLLS